MFVRNASSIKRKTIKADDGLKNYLMKHGCMPLSKEGDEWVFLSNDTVTSLIREYKKGGDNDVKACIFRCWRGR